MGNLTLALRDAYLNHLKTAIKPDTLAALRTSPLQISTMFTDSVIKRAEEEIAYYENKGSASSSCGKARYHSYEHTDKRLDKRSDSRLYKPAWKNIGGKGQLLCKGFTGRTAGREQATNTRKESELFVTKDTCKLSCCKSCTSCTWAFAKERFKSQCVRLLSEMQIKICERCFCVDQFSFVKPVTNVQLAASNLPVGARLQNYWQTWLDLGAGPKVVQILREGYTLLFRTQSNLTRSPTIIRCYLNPHNHKVPFYVSPVPDQHAWDIDALNII